MRTEFSVTLLWLLMSAVGLTFFYLAFSFVYMDLIWWAADGVEGEQRRFWFAFASGFMSVFSWMGAFAFVSLHEISSSRASMPPRPVVPDMLK